MDFCRYSLCIENKNARAMEAKDKIVKPKGMKPPPSLAKAESPTTKKKKHSKELEKPSSSSSSDSEDEELDTKEPDRKEKIIKGPPNSPRPAAAQLKKMPTPTIILPADETAEASGGINQAQLHQKRFPGVVQGLKRKGSSPSLIIKSLLRAGSTDNNHDESDSASAEKEKDRSKKRESSRLKKEKIAKERKEKLEREKNEKERLRKLEIEYQSANFIVKTTKTKQHKKMFSYKKVQFFLAELEQLRQAFVDLNPPHDSVTFCPCQSRKLFFRCPLFANAQFYLLIN